MVVCGWCAQITHANPCSTCGKDPFAIWRRLRNVLVAGAERPDDTWVFPLQKVETGAQGSQGPPGNPGSAGVPGPQGPQGDTGPPGAAGPAGTPGATGPQGNAGATGSQGPIGNTGPQGPIGNTGATGNTGSQGPQGNPGSQGIQGPPGTAPVPVYAVLANGATAMAFGTNDVVKVTPTANATYTSTVPAAGRRTVLLVLTSGTTSRTLTFGSGFKPTTTLATGTVTARVFALEWVSDGTNLYEAGRTAAMVA